MTARAWTLLLLLPFVACGDPDDDADAEPPYDLSLSGFGFADYDGDTLWLALAEVETGYTVAVDSGVVIAGGVNLALPDVLEPDVAYLVQYYADVNGDGLCESPPDGVWLRQLPPVSGNLDFDISFTPTFSPSACQSF